MDLTKYLSYTLHLSGQFNTDSCLMSIADVCASKVEILIQKQFAKKTLNCMKLGQMT